MKSKQKTSTVYKAM